MMSEPLAVLLQGPSHATPPWQARAGVPVRLLDPADGAEHLREALADAGCVLTDAGAGTAAALAALRAANQADASVQKAIAVAPADRPALERAMRFTPGLGEVWVVAPEEVGPALLAHAAEVTRQRRRYRATRRQVEHGLATLEPRHEHRTVISDVYLAALLDATPDPILSVDEQGLVLSWNPGAEAVLGYRRGEAVGRPLERVLRLVAGEPPLRLPDRLDSPLRREIRFHRRDDAVGVGELILTPVEATGRRILAVILHDLTQERLVQTQLQEQALELEAQAEQLQHQAIHLEETQLELQSANSELQDANERLAARTREAESARAEAEAANRAKSEFLATMSHELRTPINAILGYSDLLAMGISGPISAEQRAQVERLQASGRHLLMLVEDILDLARIEAARLEVANDPVPVLDPVHAALALLELQAREHRLEVVDRCGEDGIPVFLGDEDRVRQVVVNLLSNAVKFTEPGGRITVRCDTAADAGAAAALHGPGPWVRVHVEDTGIGIPPDRAESVFEPFVQLETGWTRTRGGTGLGLAISRRLARLMGGDLTLESVPGRGSRFTLWLRAAPAMQAEDRPPAAP
jgi:PAS domain S-box-containing protein